MHLWFDISFHGYGHLSQAAEVIHAYAISHPNLRLTVKCAAPREVIARRIRVPFTHIQSASDVTMAMVSAVEVDADASARGYQAFHRDWARHVADYTALLRHAAPDVVLANVAYLPLAAAKRAGIPAVGLCSLNWADIYAHYCGGRPEAAEILGEMRAAYAGAERFIRLEPAMPMHDLPNRVAVGPVAQYGQSQRVHINRQLELNPDEKLVLVNMGGMHFRPPMESWPRLPGVTWLVQQDWRVQHADAHALEPLDMAFTDLLASCDAVIGKPGYGLFTEAAVNDVPLLYLRRVDWPEEPYLVDWLVRHGRCLEVSAATIASGELASDLAALWAQPSPPPVRSNGAQQMVNIVVAMLQNPVV
ncbi:MAG: hypothetical protein ACYCZJ_15150 [Sulfuriferula sp.]